MTETTSKMKETPAGKLKLAVAFCKAVMSCDTSGQEVLLGEGANINGPDNRKGMTPLMQAAHGGLDEMVVYLVNRGADIDAKNKDGRTALSLAVEKGQGQTVEILLEGRASPYTSDNTGRTPLMWAAERETGSTAVEHVLKQVAHTSEVNARDNSSNTALLWAASEGRDWLVEWLVSAGADTYVMDNTGRNALMWAEAKGYTKIRDLLVTKAEPMEEQAEADAGPGMGA